MEFEKRERRKNLTLRIDNKLHELVKAKAKSEGLSVGNLCENMFRKDLGLPLITKPTKLGRYKEKG